MKENNSVFKRITSSREASMVIVLLVLCIIVTILSPSFLTVKSIMDMLKNNAVTMIMALGMLCVLLIGGIDISVGSTLAFSGMAIGMLAKRGIINSTPLLILIAVIVGTICGLLVGLVIAYGKVPPIIATLGFMYIYRAMAYLISNSEWASADALGDFKNFALNKILGINNVIWVMIICYVIFFIVMKWTKTGRKIYAVGSNREAAAISGINTERVELFVYTIMGLLAGLGGALAVSIYASAQPNMFDGEEMDVIASCVLGGVSMSGGRGSVTGVLIGSFLLAVIAKALPLVGISSIAQNTVQGVIILIVIVLNVVTQRMMDRNNLKGREM
ncbi:MAG: ABC transporter permease [Clostridiales bacterium]|nr:ABC transporter permease [Clostridiales bacterium]